MIGGPGGGTVIIGEEGKHKTIKHLNKIKRISRLNSDWPCLRILHQHQEIPKETAWTLY